MKRIRVLSIALATTAVSAVAAFSMRGGVATADSRGGEWAKATAAPTPVFSGLSVEEARERSEADDLLLILDFTADWCPPCKQMEATTWRDQRVIDWMAQHAIAIQVDVDQLPEVSRALGIRAMPTLIVERSGREVGRSTGFKAAVELLGWLGRMEAGAESLPPGALDATVRYTSIPDKGSSNAVLRYMSMQGAFTAGKLDEVLPEVEWLWAHGAEQQPAFSAVRLSFLAGTMEALAERHEPARESFRRFLETAQREIDADHVGVGPFGDWIALCETVGEQGRLLTWYEEHRDDDGSIDAGRYAEAYWIAESVFNAFVEQKRFADAGLVYRSPAVVLERRLGMLDMLRGMTGDGLTGTMVRATITATGAEGQAREALRESASGLSATLIAAARDQEALEISRLLLGELNDGASRKALVTKAVEWAHPLPEHVRWYAEAVEMGADLEALEPALLAGLHR